MTKDLECKKVWFHFNSDSNKWGRYILNSPEFEDIVELIKWDRENK